MAPAILRTKNISIKIYFKDHNPPHVHVVAPDAEAKFCLETCEWISSRGFSEKALSKIKPFLLKNKELLMEAWDEYQK
jgi:hypothetical protein